jgi:hypothetical protein
VAQVAGRVDRRPHACLERQHHPLLFHPGVPAGGNTSRSRAPPALRDPTCAAAFSPRSPDDGGPSPARARQARPHWVVADGDIDYEPDGRGASLLAAVAKTGVSADAARARPAARPRRQRHALPPFFNYAYGDLSMTHECTAPGDPHGPLRRRRPLRRHLRRRHAHVHAHVLDPRPHRGERLPLELVVHRQTRQTAELYGLHDRGLSSPRAARRPQRHRLRRLSFGPPRMAFDLPAGGRRLVQRAGATTPRSTVAGVHRGRPQSTTTSSPASSARPTGTLPPPEPGQPTRAIQSSMSWRAMLMRWRDHRQLVVTEPLGIDDLVAVDHDVATGPAGMEAQHQRVRERPGLATEVADLGPPRRRPLRGSRGAWCPRATRPAPRSPRACCTSGSRIGHPGQAAPGPGRRSTSTITAGESLGVGARAIDRAVHRPLARRCVRSGRRSAHRSGARGTTATVAWPDRRCSTRRR